MAIITTITTNGVKTETGQSAPELLAGLPINPELSQFVEETMRKLSGSLDGMIPSFKSNTGVALVPHAGINP